MVLHENMMVTPHVRLIRQLGQGGMGTLWVAYDDRLDREVAVKFITPEVLKKSPGLAERFKREAQAAARIRSPYVVQIHAHGQLEDGAPYMVMELLEGESLGELLGSGRRLTYKHSAQVLSQTGKALGAAHKLGVVHRDVKPDNIFVLRDEDLFVKLLDFGIAKHTELPNDAGGLTATGSVLGTPHYMSPEQLLNTKGVDHRADLWALGVVGYILVTGTMPFEGDTLAATIVAITSHMYTPPSAKGAPPAFDAWFARAFHRQLDQRFADAREMTDAFAAACDQQAAAPALTPPTAEMPIAHAPSPAAAPTLGAMAPPPPVYQAPLMPTPPGATMVSQPLGASDPRFTPPPPQPTISQPPPPMMGLTAAATPMPQTFGGAASTLSGERKSSAPMIVGVLVALVVIGGGVGAFLYTRDDATAGRPDKDDDAKKSAKPSKSANSPKPTLPDAPAGMVAVAGGKFTIGCDPSVHKPCFSDEQPAHEVTLPAFAIMTHEVTMGDYDVCVGDKKCPPAGTDDECTWQRDGHEKHPINCVGLKAAEAYCSSKGWRLPTEHEWEAAARPEDTAARYPWGATLPSCSLVVMKSNKAGCGNGEPMPVGSRPEDKSRVGAFDMGGNVREWTSSSYGAYPGGTADPKRDGTVNRGGSYLMADGELSSVYTRGVDPPTESRPGIGFRCATTLE